MRSLWTLPGLGVHRCPWTRRFFAALLLILGGAALCPQPSSASTVYWTDLHGGKVYVFDTSSSTTTTIDTPNPRYLGVDPSTGQAYWGTQGPSQIVTMPEGQSPQVLRSTIKNINDIDFDPAAGHLYWAEQDTIKRADLDGTNETTLLLGLSDAIGLDLDLRNGHMYFVENDAGRITRANLDGTDSVSVVSGLDPFRALDVFVDLENDHLYWTKEACSADGGIYRSNLDGSSRSQVIGNLCFPRSLAIDSETSKLYWTTAAGVFRSNLDGSASETLATGLSFGLGLDIHTPIPEPSTGLLLATGLLGLGATRRSRRPSSGGS